MRNKRLNSFRAKCFRGLALFIDDVTGCTGSLYVSLYVAIISVQKTHENCIKENMDSSNSLSNDSYDSSGSIETILTDSTCSVAGITSEASSYTSNLGEFESKEDAAPIIPYQFEPSTESLDISSEESDEEGENNSDERLSNKDW